MLMLWTVLLALAPLGGHGEGSSCKPEMEDLGPNLAKGRPAFQSSLYPEGNIGLASKAVDGDCNGDWYNGKSCTHTKADLEPWWYVDLGAQFAISTVVVKNRGDCCGKRIEGAEIHVGDTILDHGKSNAFCGTITDTSAGSISTVGCRGLKGRYVSILIPDRTEYLHVCEVEVYGTKQEDGCF